MFDYLRITSLDAIYPNSYPTDLVNFEAAIFYIFVCVILKNEYKIYSFLGYLIILATAVFLFFDIRKFKDINILVFGYIINL